MLTATAVCNRGLKNVILGLSLTLMVGPICCSGAKGKNELLLFLMLPKRILPFRQPFNKLLLHVHSRSKQKFGCWWGEKDLVPECSWSPTLNLFQVLPLFSPPIDSSQNLSNAPGKEAEFKENLN